MKKTILILFCALLSACLAVEAPPDPPDPPDPPGSLGALRSFSSCGELDTFLEEKMGEVSWDDEDELTPVATDAPADASEGEDVTDAEDTEDVMVEEADLVKQEGDRLYLVNNSSGLLVYDVSNPSSPVRIAQVSLELPPSEIYIEGKKIVVIGGSQAVFLDLADPSSPVTLGQWEFNGSYTNSRKVGSSVYLVFQGQISPYNRRSRIEKLDPCNRVYAPKDIETGEYSVTAWEIAGIDLNHPEADLERLTVIGSYDSEVTATPSHLYLTNLFYDSDQTGIYLFNLDPSKGGITPVDSRTVPGRIVDQFSMDETDETFRIATTTNRSTFGAADNRNYLTTFRVRDDSLTKLGQIDSITPGESITAARFLGDRAFITTYVTKEPLITFDLADPIKPVVKG